MKKLRSISAAVLCAIILLVSLTGCSINLGSNDIVILFTGGVANEAQGAIGYSSVASYKRLVGETHNLVALVDCGNSLSGGSIDLVAKGDFAAEIMADIGYDVYTIGGRDFSLGMENLPSAASATGASLISANVLPDDDEAFPVVSAVKEVFASKTVAFVGVTGPAKAEIEGVNISSDDELVTDVQETIDSLNGECDYVILLSNLGKSKAEELVGKLSGVDVVLDSDKAAVSQKIIADADGKNVVYSSAGEKLKSIGQLVISSSGTISASNVSYFVKDEDTDLKIKTLYDEYSSKLGEAIAVAETAVPIVNEYGINTIENRETPIGNLVADAYAAAAGTDIAFVSGDEIKKAIPAGDITLETILSVIPEGNKLAVSEMTGEEISNALEFAVKNVLNYYSQNGVAYGTFEGFLQVSGISFTVNTSIASTVELNEDGSFKAVAGSRRVSDIKVIDSNGEAAEIDPEKTYTVAGIESLLSGERNGNTVFDAEKIVNEDAGEDYSALINFIKDSLEGDLSAYAAKSDRIIIR